MQAKRLSGGRWIAQRNAPVPTLVFVTSEHRLAGKGDEPFGRRERRNRIALQEVVAGVLATPSSRLILKKTIKKKFESNWRRQFMLPTSAGVVSRALL